tara:strand:+ start:1209 stop:1418 length:210 start_codon:yes stop_codon:yes gene_type:complete
MSRFKPPSVEELAARGLDADGNLLKATKVRARNQNGTLKADDPSTPDVNEAWETVKSVAKRPLKKKANK